MKYFIIFSTCIYFVVSLRLNQETIDQWEAMSRPHHEKCIAESDYSDDQKSECYLDCMTRALDFMVGNTVDVARVVNVANPPKDLVEECARKIENLSKPCEAGFAFASCCIHGTAKRQNP